MLQKIYTSYSILISYISHVVHNLLIDVSSLLGQFARPLPPSDGGVGDRASSPTARPGPRLAAGAPPTSDTPLFGHSNRASNESWSLVKNIRSAVKSDHIAFRIIYYTLLVVPYSGIFLWGPIFADGQSSKFSRFNFHGCERSCPLYTVQSYFFAGLIFADRHLSAKTMKIGPHENFQHLTHASTCTCMYALPTLYVRTKAYKQEYTLYSMYRKQLQCTCRWLT
jgi:hypothetical protein